MGRPYFPPPPPRKPMREPLEEKQEIVQFIFCEDEN